MSERMKTISNTYFQNAKDLAYTGASKCKQTMKNHPKYTGAVVGTAAAAGVIVTLPIALGAVGFGAAGIASGSLAAGAMANLPVGVIAVAQSVGALGTIAGAVGGTTCAAISAGFGAATGMIASKIIDNSNKTEE
ncbi:hypothetical protein CYY_004473 [Polysphondylium violaceum]|uniref:Transmembrane protein n=1 Tax=Polysphondylium violaceum TaxID=133409 RepID=A0A8J4PV44_9MYCE|nr:hypothetical protein CYY_004473 [Polysphondylium violaceum]